MSKSQAVILDEEALESAQEQLLRFNLLQLGSTQGARRYEVHPLVREFFAVKLEGSVAKEALQRGFAQAMTDVAKIIPPTATVVVRAQVAEAVPHMEKVALRWSSVLEGVDKTWCSTGLARFYESLSQWDEEVFRSLWIFSSTLLCDWSEISCGMAILAVPKGTGGTPIPQESEHSRDEAERCRKRALEISKAELGDRHPDTATSLNNLAGLYFNTNRLPQAAATMSNVVSILEDLLGPNHPNTIKVKGNLEAIQQAIKQAN